MVFHVRWSVVLKRKRGRSTLARWVDPAARYLTILTQVNAWYEVVAGSERARNCVNETRVRRSGHFV
jgi:hypothetical protein